MSFFKQNELQSKRTVPLLPRCGLCGLYKTCKSPKMPPTGQGKKKILIIAEAPGKLEDEKGIQLIGESGQLLRRHLSQIGIDLDKDCWKTNSIICHIDGNKTPTNNQIQWCFPNLIKTIKELNPNVIILLGAIAVKSLISYLCEQDEESISKWAGFRIPSQKFNMWICPTYHPAYLLRTKDTVAELLFHKHLKRAIVKAKDKPWTIPTNDEIVVNKCTERLLGSEQLLYGPDYDKQIEIILDHRKAAKIINKWVERENGVIAFDYETNALKCEYVGAEIVSCSVCWEGKRTIAFPWHGNVLEAMSNLLKAQHIQKIAANMKFEDRWTRKFLGHPVSNWLIDTMVCAHVLDNRPGITGLKFQAFAELGILPYNKQVEAFLKSTSVGHLNRIKEVDLNTLLKYNACDSLYEYLLAMKQIRRLER